MNKRLSYNDIEKVFGVKVKTLKYRLKNGCTLKEAIDMPVNSYILDLTEQAFGRLIAKYPISGSHTSGRKWHCVCSCGNECDVDQGNLLSGRQLSCGCLNKERRHERHKDMSGKNINGVKLLRRTEDEITKSGKHYIHYLCCCPFCGEEFDARYSNIANGNTGGCGCTRHQYTHHIDLSGEDFEFCHVNRRVENQIQPGGGSRVMYECTCICGNIYIDWANTIMHGHSNCGCEKIVSKGERYIRQFLNKHKIPHEPQYWFNDLRGERNMPLFFDFALFDENSNLFGLIEYQGEQHYHEIKHSIADFGKYQREVTDPMKREYCKRNNIRLFEIAYFENIEDRCKEIYELLYHDNTVPSLQETV